MASKGQPKQQKQNAIVIESAYQGGVGDSPYAGLKNSLYSVVGFDLHSVPGLMLTAQKMTKEGGGAPTDDLYKILPISTGDILLFGQTTGKVYQNSAGVYSLLGTVAPSTGNIGILDAVEWNGYIYYSMQNYMGQWQVGTSFSGRNDSFKAFANGQATYHPMLILNEVLYIGDANNVAQWDGTTFTNNALVLKAPQIISAFGRMVTDLLIGIIISNNVERSFVYDWNTWSVSYTNAYSIPEAGVNAFIQSGDSTIRVQAGLSGNIYILNPGGVTFQLERQIPALFPLQYTPSNTCQVYYPATTNLNGIPLFGMSNISGNPCYQGVYAYGSRTVTYPTILTLPFPISTGNLNNITIWSMATVGMKLYISWFDGNSNTYGIDQIDYNNKYNGAFFETRIIKFSRIWLDLYEKIVVNYQSLPANTQINLFYDANWSGYIEYGSVQGSDVVIDTDRNQVVGNLQPRAKTMRFKVQTTASGNNAPSIEDMLIFPK